MHFVVSILNDFYAASGLKVNMSKSKVMASTCVLTTKCNNSNQYVILILLAVSGVSYGVWEGEEGRFCLYC